MSHPQAPTRQPTPEETQSYTTTLHRAALGTLVVAPALALLPPRKLDLFTLSLGGMTVFSANHLYRERYGRSIWERAAASSVQGDSSLPTERAREYNRQHRLRPVSYTHLTLPTIYSV